MSVCECSVNSQDPWIRLWLSAESPFPRAIYFPNNEKHLLFMSQDYFGESMRIEKKINHHLFRAYLSPHLPCILSGRLPTLYEHRVLKPPKYQPANDLSLSCDWWRKSRSKPPSSLLPWAPLSSAQRCFYHAMLSGKNCAFLCILFWAKYTSGNPEKRGLLTVPTPTMLCGLIKDNDDSGGLRMC